MCVNYWDPRLSLCWRTVYFFPFVGCTHLRRGGGGGICCIMASFPGDPFSVLFSRLKTDGVMGQEGGSVTGFLFVLPHTDAECRVRPLFFFFFFFWNFSYLPESDCMNESRSVSSPLFEKRNWGYCRDSRRCPHTSPQKLTRTGLPTQLTYPPNRNQIVHPPTIFPQLPTLPK